MFCAHTSCFAQEENKDIEAWKKGVVNISNRVMCSPYGKAGQFGGTGFFVDKGEGIIVTNKHIVNSVDVNETYVTFFNGREIKATLLYSDPIYDFSFLKIGAEDIPPEVIEFKLQGKLPKVNEAVSIVGNNDGQGFSVQTGLITSIHETSGFFSNQSIRISLNTKGGSSGSPIIDANGNAIAINQSGNDTYAYALPSAYFIEALTYLKNNQVPVRKAIGAVFVYIPLDKANRFLSFPKSEITKYLLNFPDALNKGIMVGTVVPSTPAAEFLKAGDIMWAIDGKKIGPNLYDLQHAVSNSKGDKVKLQIYRLGKLMEIDIPIYDLYKSEITRMVIFDGTVFYEADNFTALVTGINISEVCVMNVDPNSSFHAISTLGRDNHSIYYLKITRVGDYKLDGLNDLIKAIPELVKKEQFTVYFQNYLGYVGYNNMIFNNRTEDYQGIRYSGIGGEPLLLEYNAATKSWDIKKILQPVENQYEAASVR